MKVIRKIYKNGDMEIKCPHCRKVLCEGQYLGTTIRNYDNCPKCGKPIDMTLPFDTDFMSENNRKKLDHDYINECMLKDLDFQLKNCGKEDKTFASMVKITKENKDEE